MPTTQVLPSGAIATPLATSAPAPPHVVWLSSDWDRAGAAARAISITPIATLITDLHFIVSLRDDGSAAPRRLAAVAACNVGTSACVRRGAQEGRRVHSR